MGRLTIEILFVLWLVTLDGEVHLPRGKVLGMVSFLTR